MAFRAPALISAISDRARRAASAHRAGDLSSNPNILLKVGHVSLPFLVEAGARLVSQPPTPIGSLPVMETGYAQPGDSAMTPRVCLGAIASAWGARR
jgi:hypothetical protein